MCGRFVMLSAEELQDVVDAVVRRQQARPLFDGAQRQNAYPGSVAPVLRAAEGSKAMEGERNAQDTPIEIAPLTWGYPVSWQKRPVFNTRIESALADFDKPQGKRGMWTSSIRDGRCVVPTGGFFEPHATETVRSPRTGRQMKRPYEFAATDEGPLLLAGVCEGDHFSIVTTQPNRWVSPVHNRMPLVLRFSEVFDWLGPDFAQLADRGEVPLQVFPEAGYAAASSSGVEAGGQVSGEGSASSGGLVSGGQQMSLF